MNIRLSILTVSTALLCATLAPAQAQEAIRVAYDDGRAAEEVAAFRLSDEGRVRFLRASDVARLLRATQFWNASSRKVVLGVGRSRFVLTVDTRVVVVDGEPVLLRAPVRYDGGFVMIPMEFVLEVASQYTPRVFIWDEAARAFTPDEIDSARESGFQTASLGNRILRAETAALSLLSIIQYEWGDLSLRDEI